MKQADWSTLSLTEAIKVLDHPKLALGGFTSMSLEQPWDLAAADFLRFARSDLRSGSRRGLVNAVGNLKRALHCQTDAVLDATGLLQVAMRRNWNFSVRLSVLRDMGIVAPSTLTQVNSIRNRVEHDYALPPSAEALATFADIADLFIGLCKPFSSAALDETNWEWSYRGTVRTLGIGWDGPELVVSTSKPRRDVARLLPAGQTDREHARLMRTVVSAWYRASVRFGARPNGC